MRAHLVLILQTIALLLNVSCGMGKSSSGGTKAPTESTAPNPTETPDTSTNPPPGTVSNAAGFFVELTGERKDLFNLHKGLSTFDAPCKIELGEIIDCYVEGEEQSFYAHDLLLHYHVPSDMCAYVSIDPFYFVNRQTKYISGSQIVFIDQNGSTGVDSNMDGTIDSTLGCYLSEGTPICCVGKYTEVTYAWNESTNAYNDPTFTKVTRKMDQCLGGPATLTQPLNTLGEPVPTFKYVAGKGLSEEYKITATVGRAFGSPIAWSVNYFNSTQHSGGMPSVFYYDIDTTAGTYNVGNPYYTITCHDSAWEHKAQVRIMARDWNTAEAYKNRTTAPTNHDETGLESSPFGDKPKNDYSDWYDLELNSVTFPGIDYIK